jgi:hypothetical protein
MLEWKKFLLCLPLIGFPALSHFLLPYLEGRGFVPRELELLDFASALLLPYVISILLAILAPTSVLKQIVLFIITLVIQFVLLFTLVPGAAESEMIGFTQRINHEFSADELRACAADLRQKEQNGMLAFTNLPSDHSLMLRDARVVDNLQLPTNFQGKFQRVLIEKHQSNDSQQVDILFELEKDRGILCSTDYYENDFWRHQMADGVYAYRYMRP